jgi:hypothetical protein
MPTLANRHRIHLRHSAEQPSSVIHSHQDAFAAELPMQRPAERRLQAVRDFILAHCMDAWRWPTTQAASWPAESTDRNGRKR